MENNINDIMHNAQKHIKARNDKWWIKYAFHFTNVDNAMSIILNDNFYSRKYCTTHSLMMNENASAEVLSNSIGKLKESVRLYFRPKTPTQFQNEGFRIKEHRYKEFGCHIPVPIFFLLNLSKVVNHPGIEFTNKHPVSGVGVKYYSNSSDLKELNFEWIYHSNAISPDNTDKPEIIKHRHAELLAPESLPIDYVDLIVCRSMAEKDYLLYKLKEHNYYNAEILDKITVKKELNLFNYRDRLYIDSVTISGDKIQINVKNSKLNVSRKIIMSVKVTLNEFTFDYSICLNEDDSSNSQIDLGLTSFGRCSELHIIIQIEDCILYENDLNIDTSLPF